MADLQDVDHRIGQHFIFGLDNSTTQEVNTTTSSRKWQLVPIFLFSCVMAVALCFAVKITLRAFGFGEDGVKPGSLAAHIQNYLHPMPENSIFAHLQNLGAHGLSWRDHFLVAEFIYSILVSIFF
ncbi:uncharacterized protein [Dermacentor albipictus]|uniref:uncharacterized protein isoform X3 n=1 Tax=Dermacentor albipictus TaxID=60249 RepID=UPI0038FCF928